MLLPIERSRQNHHRVSEIVSPNPCRIIVMSVVCFRDGREPLRTYPVDWTKTGGSRAILLSN